jgi:predicted DNA binding CopG/RHH family protein
LTGIEDEKLIIRSYTEKNLKKILKEAIDLARQRSDKRFNFFISQKLLNYLESISKKEGINKSTFIRNLILEHMRGSGK